MNIPIYIDTNVIMDFIENRDSKAYFLFMKSLKCKYFIIISNIVLEELKFQNLEKESINFVNLFISNNKMLVEKVNDQDKKQARLLLKTKDTHYNDALHKVISKRAKTAILVTKNIKDFECFEDITIKRPDEL